MAGPVSVQPPPRGSRAAETRRATRRAYTALKRKDGYIGWTTSETSRGQAEQKARTLIEQLIRHTDIPPGGIERAVWEVTTGPNAGRWRWAIKLRAESR